MEASRSALRDSSFFTRTIIIVKQVVQLTTKSYLPFYECACEDWWLIKADHAGMRHRVLPTTEISLCTASVLCSVK